MPGEENCSLKGAEISQSELVSDVLSAPYIDGVMMKVSPEATGEALGSTSRDLMFHKFPLGG